MTAKIALTPETLESVHCTFAGPVITFRPFAPARASSTPIATAGFVLFCVYLLSGFANDWSLRLFGSKAYLSAVTLVLLPLAWLFSGNALRGFHTRTGRCWIAFLLWMLLAAPFSVWRGGSAALIVNYVPRAWFCFFYTCSFATSLRRCRQLMYVQIAAAAALLLTCAVFGGPGGDTTETRFRIPESLFYANSNDLALALLLGISSFLFLLAHPGIGARLAGAAGVLLAAFYAFQTGSRGSAIAASSMFGLIFWLSRGKWKVVALALAALGALFAWRSAPLVVNMIQSSDTPVRLLLYTDWRVLGFGAGLVFCVLLLFGVLPALRASAVKPVSALKGGDDDPHSRRRLMHGMIAAQVAFCFLVIFMSGLFVRTFESLSNKPLGFSPEKLLLLDVVAQQGQPPVVWDQVADNLRIVPGVERVAIAGWPLLSGGAWNNFVSVGGGTPSPIVTYLLAISPGWSETMKIPLLDGRDFRPGDTAPGQAIVNQTFVETFFDGKNPIGKTFQERENHYQVVGLVADAPYGNLRDAIVPVAYIPFHEVNAQGVAQPETQETFLVRTSGSNPLASASILRKAIPHARAGFRVSDLRTQSELVRAQTVRERLLAMLAAFFSFVALLLAAIGLYGVLSYSVQQREREFGIRIAVGARIADIAWQATSRIFLMVMTGAVIGAALGIASVRYVETLLYGVKGSDPVMLTGPALVLLAIALLSALPVIARASRIDPKIMLRAE